MTTGKSNLSSALVAAAFLICCIAGRSRAATGPSPSVDLTPPLDVSVSGDPVVIRDLSAGDFVVTLNGEETPVVSAEALCHTTESEPLRSSTQFFMFFEQNAMSLDSRGRAIQTAKALVPRLVAAGGEVAIVANGKHLRLLAPPMTDGAVLLRVLDQFEQDEHRLEVSFSTHPFNRVEDSEVARDRSPGPDRSGRLAAMMGAFSVLGPPKVVLYFADHWGGLRRENRTAVQLAAASGGFRIHTILLDPVNRPFAATFDLADESGGISFGGSASASSIADRILRKESCLYRLRFERSRVPMDAELVTWLTSTKERVKVDARAIWYAPTPEKIFEVRFAATLAAPLEHLEKPGLIIQVIPLGFKRGRHTGLLQVRLDAETAGGSPWQFAARGFTKAKRGETLSWRVVAPPPDIPVMYEAEETFSEGPYEVVAVAGGIDTGNLVAHRLEGSMPTVHGARVSISPIVVMQSGPCSCFRKLDTGRVSVANAGAFAHELSEPVLTDSAVLLVTLVCRGGGETTKFRVLSSLSGATDEVTRVLADDLESDRCVQLRDKFLENELKPGLYTYRVRVLADGQEIDTAKRLFAAADPTAARH